MVIWKDDEELFKIVREELYTAVVGDICDRMGYRRLFLSPRIRPLRAIPNVPVMIGRAMTVLEADVFTEPSGDAPFGKMLDALDDLKPGEIYICAGASPRYALVGELMAAAMAARGALGAVAEGYVRDAEGILKLGFPVFSLGPYAQDQRGRGTVLDYRIPIEFTGIPVNSGDILLGDADGVLVVPQGIEREVFTGAIEKARGEKTVQKAIRDGMSASQAFAEFGIL